MLESAVPVREQRERERDRESDRDRDRRQLDVLDEGRLQRVAPVTLHPVPAERVVAGNARAALAEVRDDGAAYSTSPALCSLNTPSTASPSTTTTWSLFVSSIWLTAFLIVVSAATR